LRPKNLVILAGYLLETYRKIMWMTRVYSKNAGLVDNSQPSQAGNKKAVYIA